MSSPALPQCPIHFALDAFGDRWTLLIIRDLVFKGKQHYREFARSPEGISTNILASRLAKLEADGIVTKSPDPDHGARVVYRLTGKGAALVPVLLELTAWSARYDPQPDAPNSLIHGAPDDLLNRLRTDREALILEIEAGISR